MSETVTESLRERKKQRTRDTITRVALELFAEQGFQQTTIAQIADAADVSPRTVSTYFPAKEEIVFGLNGDTKDRLEEAIRSRPAGDNTMEALRSWILAEREFWESQEAEFICQRRVIDSDETLIAYELNLLRSFEEILIEGLAVDLGMEPNELEPRMAGAAAVAVFDLLRSEKKPDGATFPSLEEQIEVLDQALAFITGGVNAMRDSKASS